jgi:6-pyruvoyltetrahydropterin/6-carboxytetrahydropterin synthase
MITFKEFTFEAAHQIPPFSTVHGHSFKVEVSFAGKCDPTYGWAVSLDDLCKEVDRLRAEVDHKYLNDIPGLEVPSLENIASWIWNRLAAPMPSLTRVIVTRGYQGQVEGCVYDGPALPQARAA